MLTISNREREILYLSEPYLGSVHDYAILKSEFDPEEGLWFDEQGMYVDLGFIGIAKDYEPSRLHIPFKNLEESLEKIPR
ncbi:MAG: hypothetical protein AAF399_12485 [Bacteroidota bacterium]